jgi:hypothetical protein
VSRDARQTETEPQPTAEPAAPSAAPAVAPSLGGAGTPAGVLALQRTAGNRAVSRMLVARITDEDLAARADPAGGLTPRQLIERAIRTREIGDINAVSDWSLATGTERITLIGILLDQFWVGPNDELSLEAMWNAFGDGLPQMVDQHPELWNQCLDRGMDPSGIPTAERYRSSFENDVKAVARGYMQTNLEYVDGEFGRLGLRTPAGPQSPTRDTEVELHRQSTQEFARHAQRALEAQDQMRQLHVGWEHFGTSREGEPGYRRATFDPDRRPDERDLGVAGAGAPPHSWEEVKAQWDQTVAVLAAIGAQSPTVYAAIAGGERGDVGALAGDDPRAAAATAERLLSTTRANIVATIPKLDTGDLDWRDLKPIHAQLYGGHAAASGISWRGEFAKSIGEDVIGDHETTEFWISLGLGTLAAAAFIVAEIATAGSATALIAAGVGIGASGAQAVRSWENWEDLATAARSAASEETQLVASGQADAALLGAILDTVFAVLDLVPGVRQGRAALAAAELERQLAARGVQAALRELPAGPAGAAVLERAVTELGVQETMTQSGKTAEQLLELLPSGSAARRRVEDAMALGLHAGGQTAEQAAEATVRTTLNEAERQWVGGRTIGQLVAEIPGAALRGTIARETADKLLAEAIDTLGPRAVVERCGGWRQVAQALGDGQTAAGAKLMAWRDSVFADLESYVREQLQGEVQRTGTVRNVTNDIDMSFTGPRAAEVKQAAAEYLARRLGVGSDAAAFDRMLMAGLFTDPRRMHAYDVLPAPLRERVAAEQAAKEEGLIWNHRLWQARESGAEELVREIRDQMQRAGVEEFAYRPLSPGDVRRLYQRQDALHAELTAAIASGDASAQARLASQLGETQALINATEGGGYFSGGGVRRYVSERPGEAGFDPLAGGARQGAASGEQLTRVLDQLDKLDHSFLDFAHGPENTVGAIRGIGKYGGRLREVLGEAAALPADGVWAKLAEDCARLKSTADNAAAMARMSAEEVELLVRDARSAFGQLTSASADLLAQVRAAANLPEMAGAAARLQEVTRAHVKLLRAIDVTLRNLGTLGRGVRTATTPVSGVDDDVPE